jgi:hypothetical protein
MSKAKDVYCSTCFAMPGELCRTAYVVHGKGEVTPVICRTHSSRLADSHKESLRRTFAKQLLAVAISTLRSS